MNSVMLKDDLPQHYKVWLHGSMIPAHRTGAEKSVQRLRWLYEILTQTQKQEEDDCSEANRPDYILMCF